jgi:GT2 family glycosyltransferase
MINIDIIILSYAKNEHLQSLTQQTIDTLLASEDPNFVTFNVLVIESEKNLAPFQFSGSTTIYPIEKFGFHKYLNIGIKKTSHQFICLCNNDLIFHKGWASEILNVHLLNNEILSFNPFCEIFHSTLNIPIEEKFVKANSYTMFNGILTGWCIFVKRDIFKKIGLLDETFIFWYADRDYGMSLLKHSIPHALVTSSKVTHIGNASHGTIEKTKLNTFTIDQELYYRRKWGLISFWETILHKFKNKIRKYIK